MDTSDSTTRGLQQEKAEHNGADEAAHSNNSEVLDLEEKDSMLVAPKSVNPKPKIHTYVAHQSPDPEDQGRSHSG